MRFPQNPTHLLCVMLYECRSASLPPFARRIRVCSAPPDLRRSLFPTLFTFSRRSTRVAIVSDWQTFLSAIACQVGPVVEIRNQKATTRT